MVGANVNGVRKGIGSDSRIGNKFIYPGIGYGGSCFPKDVKALIHTGTEYNYHLRILQAVEEVNNDQKNVLFNKVVHHFGKDNIAGKTFGIWGLSFKPNTDDMREAPALVLIEALLAAGAKVKAYDPIAMNEAKHTLGYTIEYSGDSVSAIKDADALLLVTEWNEFRLPDWDLIKSLMKQPVIFDGRNIYSAPEVKAKGFSYYCIGQK